MPKRWITVLLVVLFGGLALFSLVTGPLFLGSVITPADRRPGDGAGVALCVIGGLMLGPLALAVFQLLATRHPLLRICREGLELNLAAPTSLDDIPFVPALVRLAWGIVSLQGFRRIRVLIGWDVLDSARVAPSLMGWSLTLVWSAAVREEGSGAARVEQAELSLPDHLFADPLELMASAIETYWKDVESRERLPLLEERSAVSRRAARRR